MEMFVGGLQTCNTSWGQGKCWNALACGVPSLLLCIKVALRESLRTALGGRHAIPCCTATPVCTVQGHVHVVSNQSIHSHCPYDAPELHCSTTHASGPWSRRGARHQQRHKKHSRCGGGWSSVCPEGAGGEAGRW